MLRSVLDDEDQRYDKMRPISTNQCCRTWIKSVSSKPVARKFKDRLVVYVRGYRRGTSALPIIRMHPAIGIAVPRGLTVILIRLLHLALHARAALILQSRIERAADQRNTFYYLWYPLSSPWALYPFVSVLSHEAVRWAFIVVPVVVTVILR
ncbi:hypothetical protein SIIN_9327_T [Serendipita indica DSM 11827]|nr:hypothetical protein SIIN_9327_T [Serendipita indica DSM 11827]